MKKTAIIISAFATFAFFACTNLDEQIYSQISKDEFLSDDANLALYTSRPYTALQDWGAEQSMLTMIMQLSNEVAIPKSHNGSWGEARYGELQTHDIPASNKLVRCAWDYCFNGISACNDAIYVLETSTDSQESKKSIAEIKVLRSFYYLLAVDCWGNVPYSVSKLEAGYPVQKSRSEMLAFLEQEINDNIDLLDTQVSAATYGRITRDVARFILAKIYLNSEKWTGNARYDKAAEVCKQIMDSGNFSLASSYAANFSTNNENGSEAVFAIPYSSIYTPYGFYIYVMTFNEDLQKAFNIGETWNGSMIAQPDFFESYEQGDTRKKDTWLYGQVYDANGAKYSYKEIQSDGSTKYIDYVLTGAPIDESKYRNGIARLEGARIIKWPYQSDGTLKSYKICMENDFYLMRYSDVVLMYVEALVRQNKTADAAAVEEFKQIRLRAGLNPMSAAELTLDNLLLERQHELAMEGWSRQDLIRFGKYTGEWWAKSAGKSDYELLPIPTERMKDNPNLVQNPGY